MDKLKPTQEMLESTHLISMSEAAYWSAIQAAEQRGMEQERERWERLHADNVACYEKACAEREHFRSLVIRQGEQAKTETSGCPRAPAPFKLCPDCDGSFPCQRLK